jgi:N-acetylmuramic acid 6-phosphate etherase
MDHLQTEGRNPASTNLDELTPLQIVRLMNAEDARVITAVASQEEAIARAIAVITERMRAGGRLAYVGAGTSGRLGVLDASECPPTFNSPPGQVVGLIAGGHAALTRAIEGAEDRPELAAEDLDAIQFTGRDVLVGIATSGRTPYVLGAVAHARRLGAFTIGLSCNTDSDLSRVVELPIVPVVGPEVLSGSTRLKAGTATKLVLNMLTTGTMVQLGKTFGNLMVDLRATNSKLRARANRIVRTLTGLNTEEADALLQRCGGEVKTALVVHRTGTTPEAARQLLEQAGGRIGAVRATAGPSAPDEAAARPAAPLFLGIDGGGSNTVALLAVAAPGEPPGWRLVGRGQAGPSNIQAVGATSAQEALDQATRLAFVAAGLPRRPVAAACLGLAGAARPPDQAVIHDWAAQVGLSERVEVTTDAAILLAAGTPQGWGVAVIAGTGSIAFGRHPDGRTARAGGWGYLLGDEGSGYALVLSALRAVARAADARDLPTRLTEAFLEQFGVSQPQDIIPAFYRGKWDRPALAALAPIILETAESGDATADRILTKSARDLASLVEGVVRQLKPPAGPLPLAMAGGVLLNSFRYRQAVLDNLNFLGIQAYPVKLVQEPAEGAVKLALEQALSLPV